MPIVRTVRTVGRCEMPVKRVWIQRWGTCWQQKRAATVREPPLEVERNNALIRTSARLGACSASVKRVCDGGRQMKERPKVEALDRPCRRTE